MRPLAELTLPVGLALAVPIGLIPVLAGAQETPDPALDPVAIEIATNAAAFLTGQPRVSVDFFTSFDVVVDGREKVTYNLSGTSKLSRGEGFYSHLDMGTSEREFFFDGSAFQVHNVDQNAYADVPFAGGFDDLVARIEVEYGITLPIWELLSRDGTEGLLDGTTAAAYLGETRIAGEPVHHLAFSEYEHDWQVWVSTDETAPVIVAIVGTDPYTQGWPQYRAYLQNWDFVTAIDTETFRFEPPEDAIKMALPKAGGDNE